MTQAAEKVFSDAMALDERERAQLAAKLLETLEPDDEFLSDAEHRAAWEVEIQRRVDESDRGLVEHVPWERVKQMMEERTRPHESP